MRNWILIIVTVLGVGLWNWHRHHQAPLQERVPMVAEPLPSLSKQDLILSSGTIGLGGALSRSLQRGGVSSAVVSELEKTLTPFLNPRYSKPEDVYELFRSTNGTVMRLNYWPNRLQYFSIVSSTGGVFSISKKQVPLTQDTVGVSGEIKTSLWESMRSQGIPAEMIVRFAELFSWRIDFLTEPRKGDTYKLVWTRSQGNGMTRQGEIVCASYSSHERGPLLAYPLAGEFYDAQGESLRGEFLRAPLAYRRITSYFTERRFHPILRFYRPHHGIDYAAPYGTPASSIADGVVIEKGWGGGIGNQVRIRHSGSYVSIYGHLSRYASGLHVGSHVKQGQVIGYVGSTGLSTGPHLHFGFERNGQLINFFTLKLGSNRRQVPIAERAHFAATQHQANTYFAQLPTLGAPLTSLKNQ